MSDDVLYEVYAIRYARLAKRGRDNFMLCPEPLASAEMAMDYSCWAIRGGGRTYVVDTGYTPAHASRLGRSFVCDPMDGLRAIGIEPEAAEDVILTHLHYDHAGNIHHFPKARLHVHPSELPFATGWHAREPAVAFAYNVEDVAAMTRAAFEGRVHDVVGDGPFAPGIELHRVPGHSPGHLCVRVRTRRGWLLLAVDATHFLLNMVKRRPYPLYMDLGQTFAGYDRLAELSPDLDLIIAGHDATVIERYPPAAPGLEGQVARLDLDPLSPLRLDL